MASPLMEDVSPRRGAAAPAAVRGSRRGAPLGLADSRKWEEPDAVAAASSAEASVEIVGEPHAGAAETCRRDDDVVGEAAPEV
eukprot:gene50005-42635_t